MGRDLEAHSCCKPLYIYMLLFFSASHISHIRWYKQILLKFLCIAMVFQFMPDMKTADYSTCGRMKWTQKNNDVS